MQLMNNDNGDDSNVLHEPWSMHVGGFACTKCRGEPPVAHLVCLLTLNVVLSVGSPKDAAVSHSCKPALLPTCAIDCWRRFSYLLPHAVGYFLPSDAETLQTSPAVSGFFASWTDRGGRAVSVRPGRTELRFRPGDRPYWLRRWLRFGNSRLVIC